MIFFFSRKLLSQTVHWTKQKYVLLKTLEEKMKKCNWNFEIVKKWNKHAHINIYFHKLK